MPVQYGSPPAVRFLLASIYMDGAHKRTLERALQIVIHKERLAAALGVPLPDLEAYLSGEKPLPTQVFLDALDIVATQAPERR